MDSRARPLNRMTSPPGAAYVLYWAQMNRRVDSNHALAYAAREANSLRLPLLCYEGLTCGYPWANDRLHSFILQGVPETARRMRRLGAGYLFHLRIRQSDPDDMLYRLARNAALVVTDDYPVFVAARHNISLAQKLDAPCIAVDSSCVVPMSRMVKKEYAAYTIRPKIRRLLPEYLRPLEPVKVLRRWQGALPEAGTEVRAEIIADLVATSEIDHSVAPSLSFTGGRKAAERHLRHFLDRNLRRYSQSRNEPSAHATSELSPYLHFGHLSSLEVALAANEYAEEHKLIAGEFLEELIVRRELAFNHARFAGNPQSLENLPAWAQGTLDKHRRDRRDRVYDRDQFAAAATHDDLWNATQKEMLLRGKIHGYYRMYWGKKIVEWSQTPAEAVDTMVYIHDRWALDGRDPATYTNILWCLGLHDRPWQERPVFGMVRYMSLEGMRRKTDVDAYIREIRHLEETGKDPFRII